MFGHCRSFRTYADSWFTFSKPVDSFKTSHSLSVHGAFMITPKGSVTFVRCKFVDLCQLQSKVRFSYTYSSMRRVGMFWDMSSAAEDLNVSNSITLKLTSQVSAQTVSLSFNFPQRALNGFSIVLYCV